MPIKDDQFTPIATLDQSAKIGQLMHQVQSAVAFLMAHAKNQGERHPSTEPKHLRVGINSAMVETSALARLMLAKKLITNTEYFDMIIQVWTEERDRYAETVKEIDPRLSLG